jgi:tetratricopeptide (TPR) repeat protein
MKPIIELFRLESTITQLKNQGQFELALQYYDQVIQLKQNLPNRMGLAKTAAEKAYLLEQLGYRQDALQYYQYASTLVQNSPNQEFVRNLTERIDWLCR